MIIGAQFLRVCGVDTIYACILCVRNPQGGHQGGDQGCDLIWSATAKGLPPKCPCHMQLPVCCWTEAFGQKSALSSLPPAPFQPDACFLKASTGVFSWNGAITIMIWCNISMEVIACHFCHSLFVRSKSQVPPTPNGRGLYRCGFQEVRIMGTRLVLSERNEWGVIIWFFFLMSVFI